VSKALAVAFVLLVSLPGVAAADPPPQGVVHVRVEPGTPPVEWGYQLYAGNCSTCHGPSGVGVPSSMPTRGAGDIRGAGPPLAGVGARAADFYLRTGYMPLARVPMQPWRSPVLFSDAEIRALVAYVASLGPGPAIPTPHPARGNVASGLKLFTEHCAGCHQVVAEGGYVTGARVPPLKDVTARQIAEAVRIGPYVMPSFSTRQISDAQLDSIIAYVDYAKHPHDAGGWSLGHLGPVPEGLVAWLIAGAVLVATCVLIGRRFES
jgi:ubiquinol-cytochrome c reductase cytochrome c subunit